jgi:alkylhydroperoxidase/carboxymuconolactone decarboxylase family protein YurZ
MEQQDRRELIRLAINYAAGKNENMPSHVRRILKQKFNVDALEIEIEAECQQLAGQSVLELARLASKAA